MLLETPKTNSFHPRRAMSSLFSSSSKSLSPSYSLPTSLSLPPPKQTFSLSMMEENIDNVQTIINKWDPNSSSYTKVTSLFQTNRKEGKEFIKSVNDLRRAMHYLVAENATSTKLVLAQQLMQTAMKRLERELYNILSRNRDHLDPESLSSRSSTGSSNFGDDDEARSEEELETVDESIAELERVSVQAMSDLKSIADCMIGCGYGKECVKIYKVIRKSIIDEALYRLGIERFRSSRILKMNLEARDGTIKKWLNATKIAVKTLFKGERILCDHVFSASETIRESCFYEVIKEGAINLFRLPELVAKSKKSPERIFQLIEMYEAFSDMWPETELIFNSQSTSAIMSQALSSTIRLRDSIHLILSDFESTIQKDSSKTVVLGGGIHPMTISVMDYISSLADHSGALCDVLADYPRSPTLPQLQESLLESLTSSERDAVSIHLAWLILVLLCKLDCKAELHKDVSLSYLFLANNLHFIVEKVRTSSLKFPLGEDWISKHMKMVHLYASNYESMAWTKVLSSLPDNESSPLSSDIAKESCRRFNAAFEEAYQKQTSWIVQDGKLRDELKISIAKKLVPKYKEFYEANLALLSQETNLELLVRFSPDDLGNYLSDLFHGTSTSDGSHSQSSSSSSSPSSSLAPQRCISI
ncbi:exocyst complex component EXO70H1-like [Humulus lupulus]|uniref:exocyst complex component EXO70H1-like n=1 Tax=Humulus lupulus TaxID=3486 RepID=UPI002B4164AF|nr:exocyst complex component EXO70H1-like [Humulus lupulus]